MSLYVSFNFIFLFFTISTSLYDRIREIQRAIDEAEEIKIIWAKMLANPEPLKQRAVARVS